MFADKSRIFPKLAKLKENSMKFRYIAILVILIVFSACSGRKTSPDFSFDADVIPMGVDRTEYPQKNEDGEIPDEAWEDFNYVSEYFIVSTRTGERLSEKSYRGISSFKDGLAIATDGEAFFYIDKRGDKVIDEVFKAATFFSEGLAWVLDYNDRIYAIDRSGRKLFSPENASDVQLFYDGRSVVTTSDGFTEVIDKDGNIVFSTEGYGGYFVCSDMLPVSADGMKQGVMNMEGEFVLSPQYSSIGTFQWMDVNAYVQAIRPDRFVVFGEKGGGVVGSDGNVIVPLEYSDVVLDGDLIFVSTSESACWFDAKGHKVIEGAYDAAYPFDGGKYAAVCDDGLWGYIDRKGRWAIYPQWTFVASSFDANGLAVVYDNETSLAGIIDADARVVLPAEYNYILAIDGSDRYLLAKDECFGIADSKGNVILEPFVYNLNNEGQDHQHYSIHKD